ncbi:26S proteasome non-ATPase regulatory subunit 8-like [Artemia franciscana]|uniref:26S proteasome non-ATPase regulatory subunit 8 n=1 Tax=Artemia franciscana TaxID=6661 RepID=A0AA88HMU4_ARTSF|nr:hypothetical protein QYM36_015463 [Artemia franciscana]
MSANLQEVSNYLKAALASNFNDPKTIRKKLTDVKVILATRGLLAGTEEASTQDLVIAREILEVGALFSISQRDIPAFERYVAQLKSFYFDYNDELPESKHKFQVLGLNLLCLLSQSKLADFHMELELLPHNILHGNPFINHPVKLEQSLVEGRYNKIFDAKTEAPADSYAIFLESLLQTVRGDVALCMEKAFERISAKEAARMLRITTETELKNFSLKRGWQLQNDGYYYFKPEVKKIEDRVPADELAKLQIEYARELEMIV